MPQSQISQNTNRCPPPSIEKPPGPEALYKGSPILESPKTHHDPPCSNIFCTKGALRGAAKMLLHEAPWHVLGLELSSSEPPASLQAFDRAGRQAAAGRRAARRQKAEQNAGRSRQTRRAPADIVSSRRPSEGLVEGLVCGCIHCTCFYVDETCLHTHTRTHTYVCVWTVFPLRMCGIGIACAW